MYLYINYTIAIIIWCSVRKKTTFLHALLLFWRSFLRVLSSVFSSQFLFSFKVIRQFFCLQNTFLARGLYMYCTSLNIARTVCTVCSHQQFKEMSTFKSICSTQLSFFLVKYNVIILQETFLLRSLYTSLKNCQIFLYALINN